MPCKAMAHNPQVATVCLGLSQLLVARWLMNSAPLRSQRELLSVKSTQHLLMPYQKIYQLLKTVLHDTYLSLKIMNTISLRWNNVVTNDQQMMVSIKMMQMKAILKGNHQLRWNMQNLMTLNIRGLFLTSYRVSLYLLASLLPLTCSSYTPLIQRVRNDPLSTLPLAPSFLTLSGQTSLLVVQSISMQFFQDITQLQITMTKLNPLEMLKSSSERWLQPKLSQVLASGQSLGIRHLMQHPWHSPTMLGNSLIMLSTSSDYLLQLTSISMTELFSLTKLSTAALGVGVTSVTHM